MVGRSLNPFHYFMSLPLAHTVPWPLSSAGLFKTTYPARLRSFTVHQQLLAILTSAPILHGRDDFLYSALLCFKHSSNMILPSMILLALFVHKVPDPRVHGHKQGPILLETISCGCFSPQSFTARSWVSIFCPGPDLVLGSQLQLTICIFIIWVLWRFDTLSNVYSNSTNLPFDWLLTMWFWASWFSVPQLSHL